MSEFISGQKPHIDYNLIPGVVYTWPEVAAVGKTEEELKLNNVDFKTGQFPMRALGRSRASSDLDGFVKILADKKSDEILGIHMIGARCADLISEAEVAKEFNKTVNLSGIVLTRADGDARGGAAVSMIYVSQVPIKFLGVGE